MSHEAGERCHKESCKGAWRVYFFSPVELPTANVRVSVGNLPRGIASRGLIGRMQRVEERDQRVDLGGVQVLAVGRHVAAALHYLAHQLSVGLADGHAVQRGPRSPPEPPMEWQLRHCFSWKTAAPCRSSGERPFRYSTGTGSPLQASMMGLHGV